MISNDQCKYIILYSLAVMVLTLKAGSLEVITILVSVYSARKCLDLVIRWHGALPVHCLWSQLHSLGIGIWIISSSQNYHILDLPPSWFWWQCAQISPEGTISVFPTRGHTLCPVKRWHGYSDLRRVRPDDTDLLRQSESDHIKHGGTWSLARCPPGPFMYFQWALI